MSRKFARPLALRRPTAGELRDLAQRHSADRLTYAEVGISLPGSRLVIPRGWRVAARSASLGSGQDVWDAAVSALRTWQVHAGAGITVAPVAAPLRVGTVVALAVTPGPGPLGALLATCRIVRVLDEPHRFGFAYGTLALHPEQGEESFLVQRDQSGSVVVTVRAVSRPRIAAARLAPPLARLASAGYVRVYVRAWRRAVTGSPASGRRA